MLLSYVRFLSIIVYGDVVGLFPLGWRMRFSLLIEWYLEDGIFVEMIVLFADEV